MKMKKRIKAVEECKKTQCTPGNYDYDEYMRGLANGLILADAILKDIEPTFFDPKKGVKR